MKRKSIILLSSILAGSLLVGGAFAAYAVTDNADPLGFVATPGTYQEETTTYITMSFGSSSQLTNIENLEVGQHRKAGIVSLKSTARYAGDFKITLVDRTTEREAGSKKLIDYLTLDVYEGDPAPAAEGQLPSSDYREGGLALGAEGYTSTFPLTGLPAGKEYAIYLTLDESVGVYYSQMANDKVYVEVDWSPKSGEESTSYVVYVNKPSDWTNAYVYAWDDNGKENAKFPGVKMELLRDNIYTLPVPNGLNNIVFSAGDNDDAHKSTDLEMTEDLLNAGHVYASKVENAWVWGTLPTDEPVVVSYKVSIGGAAAVALTEKTDTVKTDGRLAEYKLEDQEVTAGQLLAFTVNDEAIGADYIAFEGNVDDQHKIKVAGEVDIFLKIYAGTGENIGKTYYVVYVSTPEVDQGFLFTNSKGWSDVYLYAWTGEGSGATKNAEFPGVKLTSCGQNDYGEDQYALDWGSFENIIISDGVNKQTVDIAASSLANKAGLYLTGDVDGEGHYVVATY